MSRRRRHLRAEEMDLWRQVTRDADPMPHQLRPAASKPDVQDGPAKRAVPDPEPPVTEFTIGQKLSAAQSYAAPQTTSDRLRQSSVRMDSKSFQRLKRGKLKPDARIDLHGMTLNQAHPALNRFIMTAQSKGHRLVLVITGKGAPQDPYDPAPRRRGVLKQQVPLWLTMAPLNSVILQVSEAHLKHGGSGAYYVYLRRGR